MKRFVVLAVCLLAGAVAIPGFAEETVLPDDMAGQPLRELFESHQDSSVRGPRIAARYLDDVPPPPMDTSTIDAAHVRSGFDLALEAAFYSKDVTVVARMRDWFDLLERSGAVRADDREYMHRMYVTVRDFAAAEAFAALHPDDVLPSVPTLDSSLPDGVMAVMRVQGISTASLHEAVAPGPGVQVVVVAHPLCGFSQLAVEALEKDDALGRRILARARFVAPQDGQLSLRAFADWNSSHPEAITDIAWKERDWSHVPDWSSTPTFFFYRDGTLTGRVTGWPQEGRMAELADAWRAAQGEAPKRGDQGASSSTSPR